MSPATAIDARDTARDPLFRTVWRSWIVDPLVFGFTAFPLTLIGRARRVAAIRRRRLDTTRTPTAAGTGRSGGLALVVIATFVPTLVALIASLLVVYLVYAGELYALRPDVIGNLSYLFRAMPDSEGTWGGPTLIGAWFVHAMSAIGMQIVALALIRAIGALCGRISRPLIGA